VRRQRRTRARIDAGQPTKKSLRVRYAELLKLRQTVPQAESRAKPLGLIVALRSKTVDSRVFKLLYLTAIAAAMIGWLWMLVKGLAWALDI
jgi:hypothetical protein